LSGSQTICLLITVTKPTANVTFAERITINESSETSRTAKRG
ncbi:hypothetical protein LCGC14_2329020, partial [marine sediment metagenome]